MGQKIFGLLRSIYQNKNAKGKRISVGFYKTAILDWKKPWEESEDGESMDEHESVCFVFFCKFRIRIYGFCFVSENSEWRIRNTKNTTKESYSNNVKNCNPNKKKKTPSKKSNESTTSSAQKNRRNKKKPRFGWWSFWRTIYGWGIFIRFRIVRWW